MPDAPRSGPGVAPVAASHRGPVFGLDVVRATAVTLVLLSHCGDVFASWLGTTNLRLFSFGAFYGIQLFFVLSGFLIGGLLIEQIDRRDPHSRSRSWLIFMLRRWMRTLPLYYLCLAGIALIWAPIIWPTGARLWDAIATYAAMLQNLAWPMRYPNFFDVSWSLAVEEWFYLGFSALLFLLATRIERKSLIVTSVLFVAGPIALRWWLREGPDATDHLVIYWLDSIGIGVTAAWAAAHYPSAFRRAAWLLPIGIILLWLSYNGGLARIGASGHFRRTFDFDLVAMALVFLLPAAARWTSAQGPLAAVARAMSRYSYALYLTHLTILSWVDYQRHRWAMAPGWSMTISLIMIGAISYGISRFIERPVMRHRPDDRPRQPSSPAIQSPTMPRAEASQA